MSGQNLPDNDMTKNYKMIAIDSGDQFEFYHDEQNGLPMAQISPKEGESYSVELTGNAYVVSETGKTVSSHWARSMWGRNTLSITIDPNDPNKEETIRQIQQMVMETGACISGSTIINSDSPIVVKSGVAEEKTEKTNPTVREQAVNELARRALLNAASNDPEPKVTYTT